MLARGTAGPPPTGPPPEAVRCPRCDAPFGCAVRTGGCWCAGVPLSGERRAQLAAAYDGCLCPACLRELEREGAGAPSH